MNYLKVLFGTAMLLFALSTTSLANNNLPVQDEVLTLVDNAVINSFEVVEITRTSSEKSVEVYTCKIKINGTLDNGTTIEGTVEIEGISWVKCQLIKIKDIFDGSF